MPSIDVTPSVPLNRVKPNALFLRKRDSKTVYVKSCYDKLTRTFECYKYDDVMSFIYLKATTEVFINFTF